MTKDSAGYFSVETGGVCRRGVLKTRAGDVHTPTFMPDATRGAVKGLMPEQVAATGVEMMLCNTYHLHRRPGEAVVAKLGGLHDFTRWPAPILTDSGGFQVFSLARIRTITEDGVTFKDPLSGDELFISPEISMQIQFQLGSDVMVAFDDVTALDEVGRLRQDESMERTHRWLERSLAEFQRLGSDLTPESRPLLFGVVQGGLSQELRKASLNFVQTLPVDGIAIGGLSVGEARSEMHQMLEFLAPRYDPARPHFLLGVGDPIDVRYGIEHGIDMFDCVLPTRNARHGTAWIRGDTKIHLTNAQFAADSSVIDPSCDCTTCQAGYSRGFLRHSFHSHEPLAGSLVSIHNLRYLTRLCEEYRQNTPTESSVAS